MAYEMGTGAHPVEEDRDLLAFLAAREDELLEFARELISTPSPNPPGDERAVARLVVERLEALGVSEVRQVGATEERPNVIACVPGRARRPRLILNGHLDTKPPGDLTAWRTDPWEAVVERGRLYGLGSCDMKAAVAAMVYAGAALGSLDRPTAGELVLVFTADEEAGSALGARWLAEAGLLEADAAVIGEPSGVTAEWEAIDLLARGAALFKVRVSGTQMHSSISDRLPSVNATVAMARLIERMQRELKDALTYDDHALVPTGPTVNVGVMAKAGVHYGVYPGHAEFACDIRTLPGMTQQQVEDDVRSVLERAMGDDPELRAEPVFERWIPATEIGPDEPIAKVLQEASALILEPPPVFGSFPGGTDAPHFQLAAGIPTVPAFGPGLLPLAHSPNEWIEVTSIVHAARIYALAARRYLQGIPGNAGR